MKGHSGESFDARRLKLAADRYRPAYHYLAPANWMNDPNGTIFWKGRHHLFYQYNPDGAYGGNIHWGHASTEDLVHWTDHPIALAPSPGGPDREGCWSGAAFVNKEGLPTFIYHGMPDGICLATSSDDLLLDWEKHPANPVIPEPGPGDEYQVRGASCGWVENDTYYGVTGNSINTPDMAYLFSSTDMAHWTYLHPFYLGGKFTEWGEDCACPDFFPLGNKHVLLFASHRRGTQCYVGSYADHRFTPERHKRFAFADWGRAGQYCESLSLLDGQGRRIMFGRIHEGRFPNIQRASGWAGILALPAVLSLTPDGDLGIEPVPELAKLRNRHRSYSDIRLEADQTLTLDDVRGDRLEIRAVLEWSDAEEIGLKVCCSPDGGEQTLIRFNANPWHKYGPPETLRPLRAVMLDISRSSVSADVYSRDPQCTTFDLPYGRRVDLRVFVDRSVVEVFVNGLYYLAKRIYPSRKDSLGVQVYAVGGKASVVSMEAWDMEPVWPIQ